MKKIAVVTVTYNSQHQIDRYSNSLSTALDGLDGEVWVIDNASKDGTKEELDKIKFIKKIYNSKNKGFGRANNQALQKIKSEYVLILNPDTVIPKNTLQYLLKYADKKKEVGLLTCRVELEDGTLDRACRRGFPTPWRSVCRMTYLDRIFPESKIFGGYNLTYLPENDIAEIDSAVGAFMLIKKKVLDTVGFFDEDFFMYGEDIDLCYRIKQAGWKIIYNPKVRVLHYKGVSSGIKSHSAKISTTDIRHRARMIRHFHLSMHIFYNKHYKNKYPTSLNKLIMGGINLKMWAALLRLHLLGY
jgi:GT2 family glycosyltransferase